MSDLVAGLQDGTILSDLKAAATDEIQKLVPPLIAKAVAKLVAKFAGPAGVVGWVLTAIDLVKFFVTELSPSKTGDPDEKGALIQFWDELTKGFQRWSAGRRTSWRPRSSTC
ncbi:hypothetical protein [Frigoriglobus tundricola]|uniref:Uncharacterized protein n=1 Tax=Frigoriglobus tundricola TaxID=2774151 RepID=A0A6M5YEV4_9BACT|nr:hypothetical protein [Frigoriglobus tundricola]QJW92529.1 hypothetical protein FTUN_0025 [Frigoriglobus tundricola]